MDDPDRRLNISLRLKAARYLAGGRSEKGTAVPLTVRDLAEDPLLHENGITKNRLDEIEQMRATARPMELEKIAQALGLPASWFGHPPIERVGVSEEALAAMLAPRLLEAVQALRRVEGRAPLNVVAPDHQTESAEANDE